MYIEDAKRIVIKIGSALVVDQNSGELRAAWLDSLADDVSALRQRGKEVIIVTSGAVALGRNYLGLTRKALKLEEKQAAAACGQIELIKYYKEIFARHKLATAQILLTIEDSENRRRYLNARSTLETLLKLGVIPIINENDTVATAELRFGDNDRLAARVAQMTSSDVLILLSDIDGLYTANPQIDSSAVLIPHVAEITGAIENMAGTSLSDVGTGGMITKISAAKIAVSSGCHMAITLGTPLHALQALQQHAPCTWFTASASPRAARKNWIAATLHLAGEIFIDDGALQALLSGKSLLPAGVVSIKGEFHRGDAVCIKTRDNRIIGRGISAYSAKDAALICGQHSSAIEELLGFAGREELIHRDDLVLQ
jgi:glutamate 5-kinase